MDARRTRAATALFLAAIVAYGLDRATKLWAEAALRNHPIDLVPGAVSLRFTTNSGGAFSIGQSAPWFFVGITSIVIVLILVTAFRHTTISVGIAVGMVLGGALGNLTDRAMRAPGFRGEVIDFIDLHVWPVFNLADASIVVGAILLAWVGFRERREDDERAPAST